MADNFILSREGHLLSAMSSLLFGSIFMEMAMAILAAL